MVERFLSGCGLVQCYKCCAYGHIAKNCRAKARCGHCAGPHETRECQEKQQSSCAVCKAKGYKDYRHKAWYELCPERTAVRAELRRRLDSRPAMYATEVRSVLGHDNVSDRRNWPSLKKPGTRTIGIA